MEQDDLWTYQKEYKVTLDFKVEYIEDLMLNGWHEFYNFTAMISVVMPKLKANES